MTEEGTKNSLMIKITGTVQGVGFRPFVYRLAKELDIKGWVSNTSQGVVIEAESLGNNIDSFLARLRRDKPAISEISSMETVPIAVRNFHDFTIKSSDNSGDKAALMLPDIAACPECLREIFDPADRRYHYPFTNCTNCGPRYSIIESLPYDRANTTMKIFEMCEKCRAEYEDPSNRRFHAQPNACPECGPQVEFWDINGKVLAKLHEAIRQAAEMIKAGKIVALKGLGGFQLLVDARDKDAVAKLRRRKERDEKPFAVMYPDMHSIINDCEISELEKKIITSYESPIVIAGRKPACQIAENVAPGNPNLGVMIPYTPLHHLLMAELGFPVVATSGNLSDEPICIENHEAFVELGGIADYFLIHNRPIARHVDDSVVRIMADKMTILRRARGFAPLPIAIDKELIQTLAVGGHLKNSVAIAFNNRVFISQHIGDLETIKAFDAFKRTIDSLSGVYEHNPQAVICDKHPDYISSQYAESQKCPVIKVQHHLAHVLSCMTENNLEPPVLGVAWDGVGYGDDGTIWGGEFIKIEPGLYERVAHLRYFSLPGGEKAVKEPRRSAIGLLYEIFGDDLFAIEDIASMKAFKNGELKIIKQQLAGNLNSPRTCSAGRLFDAVASLLGLKQVLNFEGQAAMELEFMAEKDSTGEGYNYDILRDNKPYVIDWEPMIKSILDDIAKGIPSARIARMFHNTLIAALTEMADIFAIKQVAVSGGCFQNKYLLEKSIESLTRAGFKPQRQSKVPPHDGGICLGQIGYLIYDMDKETK